MTAEDLRRHPDDVDPFELARPDHPIWLVGLCGDEHVLRYLAKETTRDTLRVRRLRREWVLFAQELQACSTADELSSRAGKFVLLANSIRRRALPLGAPIESTGEYRFHPDGRLEVFVSIVERIAITDSLGGGPHGSSDTYCDRVARLALDETDVLEILKYREAPDAGGWAGLRRLIEAIAKNRAGGRSEKHALRGYEMIDMDGWLEDSWMKNLARMANSKDAGDSARHGLSDKTPPPESMSLDEARRGVAALFYRWIDWKLSQQ